MSINISTYSCKYAKLITLVLLMCFSFSLMADETYSAFETDTLSLDPEEEVSGSSFALKINEISPNNLSIIADEAGEYDDWFEIYNFGDDTINLKGIYLSDNADNLHKFQISTDTFLLPHGYIIIWADEETEQGPLHTNFKLEGQGESLFLSNADGEVLDYVTFSVNSTNVTYGRLSSNILLWNYFMEITPGDQNPENGSINVTSLPSCSLSSGFFQDSILVELSHPDTTTTTTIHYTLNGKVPSTSSTKYTKPFYLKKTTTLRFIASKMGYLPSVTQTRSFLYNDETTLDVLSIVGNPSDLTNSTGLFSTKRKGVEKSVHIEYFGEDKELKFHLDGGIQLHSPKTNSQLSFRLYARSGYGFESMDYQIFKDKDISSFKRLIFRNSGNDGTVLKKSSLIHFRDGLHQTLFHQMGHPEMTSAFRPVSVYINGAYWGVYNTRERIDKHFIASNFAHDGEMDLLERAFNFPGNKNAIEGDYLLYNELDKFAKNKDLSVDTNFNYIDSFIDLKSYIDYWIHEIYIGNFDWMNNNIKMYRPKEEGAKFKWLLWDTDHGAGMPYGNYGKPEWNTLSWSLSIDQVRTENGRDNVFMRKLIENVSFRNRFINRYADLLNSLYLYENIENTIDSMASYIENDMLLHQKRWKLSESKWREGLSYVKNYYQKRNDYVREDIKERFELEEMYKVFISVLDTMGGTVHVNSIKPKIESATWQGTYFKNVPITLKAVPKEGYRFSHWETYEHDYNPVKTVSLTNDFYVTVHFEPASSGIEKTVINEIFISEDKNKGWIELYNPTDKKIDFSGWWLETSEDAFYLGDYLIESQSYLVIANTDSDIEWPDNIMLLLLDDFYLEQDDMLKITNASDFLVDYVDLSSNYSWPSLADKYDFSMELISFDFDNEDANSWRSSIFLGGTPGKENSKLPQNLSDIRINEVLAGNNKTNYDDFYEYDDWIELYNNGEFPIDLRGLLITNNKDNPVKYQVPLVTDSIKMLPANYELIWADNSDEQGALHTNFKLSLDGEEIYLYENNGYELILIDKLQFDKQFTDISLGAIYDGSYDQWSYQVPTPKASNHMVGVSPEMIAYSDIVLYPLYTDDFVTLEGDLTSIIKVEIYNSLGQKKMYQRVKPDNKLQFDVSSLKSGIYFLRIFGLNSKNTTKTFFKR